MLAISETSNGYFCFEWLITEDGPKIINCQHVNFKDSLSNSNTLKKVISLLEPNLKNEPQSLSISLNNYNYNISEFEYDSKLGKKESVFWYEQTFLDNEFKKSHDLFYYPLHEKKSLLVLSIAKKIKKQLIENSLDLGYDLIYISADIFSASTGVKQIYKLNKNTSYIIWKLAKSNYHYLLYYKKGLLCAYLKVKKNNKSIKVCIDIGKRNYLNGMIEFVFSTLINKKYNDNFKNVYIYQTKINKKNLHDVLNVNKNIKIIDLSPVTLNENNQLKYIQYAENGISFKGLDV